MRYFLLVCQIFLAGLYIVPVWAQQAPKQRTVTYLSLEEALHEAMYAKWTPSTLFTLPTILQEPFWDMRLL